MRSKLRGLMLMVFAAALVFGGSTSGAGQSGPRRHAVAPSPEPKSFLFKADQLEYYLNDDGIAYIRPGLKLTIVSVTNVAPGQKPVVEFTLTDSFDQPLDRLGKTTPGPINPAFVLAQWNPDIREYHALTTRTRSGHKEPWVDAGGTFTDLEMGHYKYTFNTSMPADLDVTKMVTLGGQGKRTLNDIIGKDYWTDNVFKDFRPDGGTPSATWGAMALSKACNRCHDPLALHGQNRRDPKLCMMCHTSENVSAATGNQLAGKVFFHKIHMGENLPSVKAGTPFVEEEDYSEVAFPQDIRNCTACHETSAPEKDIWYTRPNRAACGSCHDDVNFTTGANHPAGAQSDDKSCARCHEPEGDEFDASIQGAHTNPLKSKQLKGLAATVVSVSNVGPGKKPTAVFAIKNGDGTPVDGTKLTTFAPMIAGPTKNYSTYFRESGVASGKNPGTYDPATGNTTFTWSTAMPDTMADTWAVTADIYRNVNLKRADGKPDITVRESAFNNVNYVAVTGEVTPRRTAVVVTNCNVCHETLALHGGQRKNTEECVICHNPTATDAAQRPASEGPPESISFQRHIHRIHSGHNLTQEWTVYGFNGSKNNFNMLHFPGDRRNCLKCHVANSYTLPLQPGIAAVPTLRDYFSPQGPHTAACLGCHDNVDAAAHAYLNTAFFAGTKQAEACATCHGTGKDWDVQKVHAR